MATSSSTAPAAQRAKDGLRDAVNDFRAALSEEQRRDFVQSHGLPNVDDVMIFTAKLDHRSKQRAGQSFASRLYNVLLSVANFCHIVDTFIQSNPDIAALVWGSIKLTMMVTTNVTSHFLRDAVSRLFMQIGNLCPIFSEYEVLYPGSVRLQTALKDFYASIIRCCRHPVESMRRTWHARIAMGLRMSFEQEFAPDLEDVRSRSDHAKDQISLAKAQADVQHQKLESRERDKAHKSRKLQSGFFSRTDRALQGLKSQQLQRDEQARRRRREKLLDRISPHEYLRPFKESMRRCYSGTTQWVLESQEFKDWLDGTYAVLWCSGKIGSGKTIITSSAIQHSLVVGAFTGSSTSFFFIQSGNQDSLHASVILKFLIRQRLNANDQTPEWMEEVAASSTPTDLVEPMCELFKQEQRCYIFVDGLDECREDVCRDLLSALSTVVRSCPNLGLSLTSRNSLQDAITKHFPDARRLTVDSDANFEDIATYVKGSLREKIEVGDLKMGDPSLLKEIEDALAKGAQGMSLWVFFQLQDICLQHCDEDIRLTLKNLPKDPAETFRRLLRRIQREGHAPAAQAVFRWIAAAKRPLSLDELQEALAIKIGQQSIDPSRIYNDMDRISSWTANLVQVGEEDFDAQFAHSAIRVLLTQQPLEADLNDFHVNLEAADGHLGEICVTYLHFSDFQRALVPRRKAVHVHPDRIIDTASKYGSKSAALLAKLRPPPVTSATDVSSNAAFRAWLSGPQGLPTAKVHPFLDYAARYWVAHTAGLTEDKTEIWRLWRNLVLEDPLMAERPWSPFADTHEHILAWACHARHHVILRLLCAEKDHSPTIEDQILVIASEELEVDLAIIDIAVKSGTSEDTKELALRAASARGHLYLVNALLAANVRRDAREIQSTVNGPWSVMIRPQILTASYREPGEAEDAGRQIVPLPSLDGSRTRDYTMSSKSALYLAAEAGHARVVEALLKANGRGIWHTEARNLGSALLQAAAHGHEEIEEIVEQLLEAGVGADDEERPLGLPTALQAAARAGHQAVVDRLLKAGADVNAEPSHDPGLTALQAAASIGHSEIVKLLLDHGADIWAPTAKTPSEFALHLAVASGGLLTVVEILSAMEGLPLEEKLWEDRRALHVAKRRGHTAVLRLLESAQYCVYWDAQGGTYRFAFPRHPNLDRLMD